MEHEATKAREQTLARLREIVAKLFADHPEYRSVLFSVAQYWNDQANDETHAHVIASVRDVPVWPHDCRWSDFDETGAEVPVDRREACSSCHYDTIRDPWVGVHEWEPYCHEHANQSQESAEAYLPYALVRRGVGDALDVEIVGRLQRPDTELLPDQRGGDPWANPRARSLFDQVCANPGDDGPRAVLSDYLLESRTSAIDPRGEYLALALAASLDDDARARREQLLVAHEREWLQPIGAVIPAGCAVFERGFPAHVEVYTRSQPHAAVSAASTWGTVETLRMLPGSIDLIDPAMTALRDVGIVHEAGLEAIARAQRPWRIETLQARGSLAPIQSARNLPQLRHLIVPAAQRREVARLAFAAPWYAGLERVTLVGHDDDELRYWRDFRKELSPVDWMALAEEGENLEPAGWCIAIGPDAFELEVVGWHPSTTLDRLVEIVQTLEQLSHANAPMTVASSAYRVVTAEDIAYVRERAGREILLRP